MFRGSGGLYKERSWQNHNPNPTSRCAWHPRPESGGLGLRVDADNVVSMFTTTYHLRLTTYYSQFTTYCLLKEVY